MQVTSADLTQDKHNGITCMYNQSKVNMLRNDVDWVFAFLMIGAVLRYGVRPTINTVRLKFTLKK